MGKANKELSGEDAAMGVVTAGAMAQLSRNKKINNLGSLGIIVGLIALIGEGLQWLLKWIIWKPCVFIAKGFVKLFWWTAKIIYYYPIKYAYQGILKLIEYIKVKKAVE